MADAAYSLKGVTAAQTYLNIEKLIEAAKESGADAVHPGYGFLSENAEFSAVCSEYGIKFIGPTPEMIRLMGDKSTAKDTMKKAGVPTIPGSDGLLTDLKTGLKIAKQIGYPVILKATAGGGGRGMRIDRKSTRLNSSHSQQSRMPSSA